MGFDTTGLNQERTVLYNQKRHDIYCLLYTEAQFQSSQNQN